MTDEHPFAPYVRIIGKGPHLSRPLTEDESLEAWRMILAGRVEPVQIGAFLCVLRVRTEEPEEAAGFVRAVRETLPLPAEPPRVDLDWPTYAGKSRQLPWYLLAALLLAGDGMRVFMHGADGHTPGRLYARQVLAELGLPEARDLDEAARHLSARNFAFLPLGALSPPLEDIMGLKRLLGLRSPVNTFARMLNPFHAPQEMQGIFHPGYRDLHRETARRLGQPRVAVFKGDGGEAERRPNKPLLVQNLIDGADVDEEWPVLLDADAAPLETLDPARLAAVWRGDAADPYGEAAVVGTAAIALRLSGRAGNPAAALSAARRLWEGRARDLPGRAA